MKKLRVAALAAALVGSMVAGNAMAAERGAFIGGEWGGSRLDVSFEGESEEDSDHGFLFRGGYYFTPNVAVEVFHASLYDYSEEGYSAEIDGNGIGVVGRKNFGADNNGFYIQGRAGLFRSEGKASVEGLGSISDKSNEPYFGVGAGYDFNSNFGIGLNYTRYRGDFGDVSYDTSTLTAGIEFRF